MDFVTALVLGVTGLVAGIVDSMVGGGGLFTLPALSEVLGPGAHAIGSNKIVGFVGAFVSFWVYRKHQRQTPILERATLIFLFGMMLGSITGSVVTPHLSKDVFRILFVLFAPVILILVLKKSFWLREKTAKPQSIILTLSVGLAVGFYDGFFGPGGGTFMLIALIYVLRMPLFQALLISKLANSVSAGSALVGYSVQGYVHPSAALWVATGMLGGSFLGANWVVRKAERIIRPMLILVVILLVLYQVQMLWEQGFFRSSE